MLFANPHPRDAVVKTASPPANTRFRPKRSASEPAVSTVAASASVYASTIHCTPDSPACRSVAMCGSAVLITAMSSISIAVAVSTTASVQRRKVSAPGDMGFS